MRAIILAAGRGARLAQHDPAGTPKCLLEFGGKSLLRRHFELLGANGISRVDLVVGYAAERVIGAIAPLPDGPRVAFPFNRRYQRGSVLSLLTARDALLAGDPVLLMDADVLYHPAILARLLASAQANCFLLDRAFVPGDEPVKIALRRGSMVEFGKRLPADLRYDVLGESVGFFRFDPDQAAALETECRRLEAAGVLDAPHEEALRGLVLRDPGVFGCEDVTGLPWIEIDFAADVQRANDQVLPAIRAELPDF